MSTMAMKATEKKVPKNLPQTMLKVLSGRECSTPSTRT